MRPVRFGTPLMIALCATLLLSSAGCEEFNARRKINEANTLYKTGKFEAAAAMYESALADKDIDVGHFNLGVTYVKLFIPGNTSKENKETANKAADHLQKWLAKHPKDNDARKIMTKVWVDSGDFERALQYWEAEHKSDPKNRDVMSQLASINHKAGRFEETVKWILMDADNSPNAAGKVKAYQSVGNTVWAKLSNKDKVVGAERIKVADVGISALQAAAALDANNADVQGLLAAIFNFRSLAHGVAWAAAIDKASAQNHNQRARVLREEAKKKQQQASPAPTPPPPAGAGG